MNVMSAGFHREAHRRIAETFPRSRLPFYQSLRLKPALSAYRRLERILRDEERAWHLFLLSLHILYEARHELPPLSAAERKSLRRHALALRVLAGRLRKRRFESGGGGDSAAIERMADRLERMTHPSADGIYNLKTSRGGPLDPGDAISVFELAYLFRDRLRGTGHFPIIADFLNTLPGRAAKRNVQTIKGMLARLEEIGFQPRVQVVSPSPGLVTLKFRSPAGAGPERDVS